VRFKILFVIPLACVFAGGLTVQAREVQKVGSTSMQTLKIATSVRAIGMGETYCAVSDDIQSVFWNPAGLIHLEGWSAYFSQINMPADIQFNTAAVARNFGDRGVFGVHLLAMTTDDMPVRTIFCPEGTGENFMAYDIIGGVSWAQRLTDRFVFGLNLRIANSGLEEESYTGVLADIGTLYESGLRSLRIGMSVQNFGPDIEYSGDYLDYADQGRLNRPAPREVSYSSAPPPTIYRIGLAANPFTIFGIEQSPNWDGTMAIEMSHPNDNRERINLGIEVLFMDMLAMRGGYKLRYKNNIGYDEERWTAGFGLSVPLPGNIKIALDYAYMDFGLINEATDDFMTDPHRFSLAVNF